MALMAFRCGARLQGVEQARLAAGAGRGAADRGAASERRYVSRGLRGRRILGLHHLLDRGLQTRTLGAVVQVALALLPRPPLPGPQNTSPRPSCPFREERRASAPPRGCCRLGPGRMRPSPQSPAPGRPAGDSANGYFAPPSVARPYAARSPSAAGSRSTRSRRCPTRARPTSSLRSTRRTSTC